MKKFFALVLAVAMVMSLAAVSFADVQVDKNQKFGTYSGDKDAYNADGQVEYGETAYMPLIIDGVQATDYEEVEKLKIKVSYEMGGDLVENVSIVKKYIVKDDEYQYFVAVKVADKATTADADIIGTFEFNRKADSKKNIERIKDDEVDFEINVWFVDNYLDNKDSAYVTVDNSEVNLDWNEPYVLKFESDDEVDINFGTEPNEGTFTVDVSGQGKLFVKYNTNAVDAIVDANPGVKMHFVNFNGAKFNRTGEFMYEMEDGVAAYKVVDGALVAIPGCEYDDADEAFYFNTRVLESYVFATAELVNPVVDAPAVEVEPAPEVTNPSTGA